MADMACFTTSCSDPVVGQCPGFRDPNLPEDRGVCGHFYCQHHSDGTLCSICAEKKASVELREDYRATLSNVFDLRPRVSLGMSFFSILLDTA